jgi:uncharacterized membrane protein
MLKRILLYAMALFYIIAGVNHFVSPAFYVAIMPPYLPWHLELVYLSGIAEILCGLGLLFRRTRVLAAWATIALLVAIFPANIHVALHDIPVGGRSQGLGIWNWVRLPFQLVLIAWAWWYTRDDTPIARVGAVQATKRV